MANAPHKALAFVLLGGIFNLNSMIWCHLLAVVSARVSQRVRLGAGVLRWLNRSIGALLVGFGVKLALAERG